MGKTLCFSCGNKKNLFARNYAGLKVRSGVSLRYSRRILPSNLPKKAKGDYLCNSCAIKLTFKCIEHGNLPAGLLENGTWTIICPDCETEKKEIGLPPDGYDSIEAVECKSGKDPAKSVYEVHAYTLSNPCSCGGEWEMVVQNSPMPSGIEDIGYKCTSCGKKKWIRFRLWKTGAPFPKA